MLESTKNQIGQILSENHLTGNLRTVILYRNSTEETMDYPIFHAILTGLSIYFCLYVGGILVYTAFEQLLWDLYQRSKTVRNQIDK